MLSKMKTTAAAAAVASAFAVPASAELTGDLTLHAWGVNNPAIPGWQRLLLRIMFPLQRAQIRMSFRISDESFARSVANIEATLADLNAELLDGRQSLLGGDELNYTDFAFAAMSGLWLMPPGYGGGKADAVRVERDQMPEPMRMDHHHNP